MMKVVYALVVSTLLVGCQKFSLSAVISWFLKTLMK